ncbi:MAG: GDSL-type esterase/lipase family protein [Lachnospiraceae bacterium]|nr:GDSL-type esterase/lipase family protein [Lachnospiraceae bacterium]
MKRILCFLLAALFVFALPSCGKPGEKPDDGNKTPFVLFDESGAQHYSLVRPDYCSDMLTESFVSLRKGLEAYSGKEMEMATDFIGRTDSLENYASVPEILVGLTNRAESTAVYDSLPDNGYEVRKIGNKLVVLGKDDTCTAIAVSKLLAALKPGEDGNVYEEQLIMKGEYSVTDGPVNGVYYVSKIGGWFKSQGRTRLSENGLSLLCSSTSFEFTAECKGKVSVVITAGGNVGGGNWGVFFTVYVDGNRLEERLHVNEAGDTELVLADGLPEGTHTFSIVRQTEWDRGDIYVSEIRLDGALRNPPENAEHYIEFIGDSLTTGFGNLSEVIAEGEWGGCPLFQDSTLSYCDLTAKNFGADYSVVAIQGIGVVCGPQTIVMGDVYRNYPRVNEKDYDCSDSRKADLVVINMGTNDWENKAGKGIRDDVILDALMALGLQAKEMHPDAKIVYVTGMQPSYTKQLEGVVHDLGGEDAGFYYCELPQNLNGHDYHPDLSGHRAAADKLTAFIKQHGIL